MKLASKYIWYWLNKLNKVFKIVSIFESESESKSENLINPR